MVEPQEERSMRMALGHVVSVGSFYNAYEGSVKGKLPADFRIQFSLSMQQADQRCTYAQHDSEKKNILKWIGFSHEQRINIYLRTALQQNTAAILRHPPIVDDDNHFLYFQYLSSTETLVDDLDTIKNLPTGISCPVSATHLVTQVSWGITLLLVLKIPHDVDQNSKEVLDEINKRLTAESNHLDSTSFDRITVSAVYSNIPQLTSITELDKLCDEIRRLKNNPSEYQPVQYQITPLCALCPSNTPVHAEYHPWESSALDQIEDFYLKRWPMLQSLNQRIEKVNKVLDNKSPIQMRMLEKERSRILTQHEEQLNEIKKHLADLRHGSQDQNKMRTVLEDHSVEELIHGLESSLDKLEEKTKLIKEMETKGIEYVDVATLGIKEGYTAVLVKEILHRQGHHHIIMCATDELRQQQQQVWKKEYAKLTDQRSQDDQTKLLYADFTFSSYRLDRVLVLDSRTAMERNASLSSAEKIPVDNDDQTINILLLGPTGVGKSTFINALVNYVRFSSLDEAEREGATVVIPVSFIMGVGSEFEEKVIKFGEADPNENHNKEGRSVTEGCKAYTIMLEDGRKLCLIDTPGFSDTRGVEQDEMNVKKIFNFIGHLSHLDGICLLFKSNEHELQPYFRSYLSHLKNYFGDHLQKALILCYTHSRSTFYNPGNTQKLLKNILEEENINIPLMNRSNVFCFDSESFRFLVAKQNSVEFRPDEYSEFHQGWTISKKQATQLLERFSQQRRIHFNENFETFGYARHQILLRVRPILEALRTIIYNMALHNKGQSLQLHPTPFHDLSQSSSSNRQYYERIDPLLIPMSPLAIKFNRPRCNPRDPFPYGVDYILKDKIGDQPKDLEASIDIIREAIAVFDWFLRGDSSDRRHDLFLRCIDRIIKEENAISSMLSPQTPSKEIHETACQWWTALKLDYQQKLSAMENKRKANKLTSVSACLSCIDGIPIIESQLEAIRSYQRMLFEINQRLVQK